MQAVERAQLAAEHERLKVAKAIVDLQVEGNAQTAALDARVAELRGELGAAEKAKKDLAAEARRAHGDLEEREGELVESRGEKEDLVNELLASRLALQQVQEEGRRTGDKSKQLDLELVSTVNQLGAAEKAKQGLVAEARASRGDAAQLQARLYEEG